MSGAFVEMGIDFSLERSQFLMKVTELLEYSGHVIGQLVFLFYI